MTSRTEGVEAGVEKVTSSDIHKTKDNLVISYPSQFKTVCVETY